jgi:hypothetical protein
VEVNTRGSVISAIAATWRMLDLYNCNKDLWQCVISVLLLLSFFQNVTLYVPYPNQAANAMVSLHNTVQIATSRWTFQYRLLGYIEWIGIVQ